VAPTEVLMYKKANMAIKNFFNAVKVKTIFCNNLLFFNWSHPVKSQSNEKMTRSTMTKK